MSEPDVADLENFKNTLETNIGSNFVFHLGPKQLFVDISVHILSEDKTDVFRLDVRHTFELDDFETFIAEVSTNNKILNLPEDSQVMFTSIAYSTTRGILKEKLSSSRFREYVLPIIEPSKLSPVEPVLIIEASDNN